MAYGSPSIDQYRKSAVNAASPLELVIMLYDGALKFMEGGKHAMAQENLEKQNELLQKAQAILIELISCLDFEKGGEIAGHLTQLYTYAHDQLVEANIQDDPVCIDRAIRVLSELREGWVAIAQQQKAAA